MSAPSAINLEAIDNLRSLSPDDGDAFLQEIINIFLEDTPHRLEELLTHRASGDNVSFVRAAHSIKGSASNLGAMELRNIAEKLEHHARNYGMGDVDDQLAAIESAFLRAKGELEKLVPGS